MLTDQQYEAKWNEIKGALRNLWGRLTDEELEAVKGNLSEVTSLVEEKYGETKHEIREKLQQLFDSFDNETDKGISPDRASYMRSPLQGTEDETMNWDPDYRSKSDSVNTSP